MNRELIWVPALHSGHFLPTGFYSMELFSSIVYVHWSLSQEWMEKMQNTVEREKKKTLGIIFKWFISGPGKKNKEPPNYFNTKLCTECLLGMDPRAIASTKISLLKKTLYGEQNWLEQVQLSGRADSFHREKPAFIDS